MFISAKDKKEISVESIRLWIVGWSDGLHALVCPAQEFKLGYRYGMSPW